MGTPSARSKPAGERASDVALGATIHRVTVALSDVERGVYETLDLRLARHPSETTRFLVTRLLAYALSYEEGIAFSKGGISDTDQPPIAVHDPTGILLHWVDVGSPAAERLHKAAKAARRVSVYTTSELGPPPVRAGEIHRATEIEWLTYPPALAAAIESKLDRTTAMELVRSDGHLYVTVAGVSIDGPLVVEPLAAST